MAWTAPRTWVTSEVVTAANCNTHIRDNLSYLKTQQDLDDTHRAATAAVHGLPAGAYALGNKNLNAAGEFIEHGTAAVTAIPAALSTLYRQVFSDITFPVAFASAPQVVVGVDAANGGAVVVGAGFRRVTTILIDDPYATVDAVGSNTCNLYYIAIGT